MKKPIDPSLGSISEDQLLKDLNTNDEEEAPEVGYLTTDIFGETGFEKSDETLSVEEIMDEIEGASLKGMPGEKKTPSRSKYSSGHSHRHSHHHHHSSSSRKKKKKEQKLPVAARIAIGILVFLLLIVVLGAVAFFVMRGMGQRDLNNVSADNVNYQETIEYKGHTYQYNDDVVSLAFLGIDQRTLENSTTSDFVGASDADVVVSVNTKTGETSVIAIPRDTMVDVDMYLSSGIFNRTEKTQLCLAYAYGDGKTKSCENAVTSISRVLYNVPIQKYFALDLDGIAPLNDAIGGVTVTSLYDIPEYNIKVGDEVTLKGDMAETYVRTRDMDSISASLNRTDRQVQYINAFANQALPAVVKDFSTISKLYNTASKYSRTNLTLNNATYVGSLLLSKGVTDFKTYTIKGEMKADENPLIPGVVHAEFYPDEDSLMETVLAVFYTQID